MPPQRPAPIALMAAVGLVLLFIVVQGVALEIAGALGWTLRIGDSLQVESALVLSFVQAAGIVAIGLLVLGGMTTLRRLGLRGGERQPKAGRRGWNALLPVTLFVLGPSMLLALLDGRDLVHPSLDLGEALAVTLLAVLIGINEELWFRGLVVDQLGGALRPWLVIIGSALLFGLPHLSDSAATVLNAAGVALAVGVPFACVRLRYGSLWPLIVVHSLIDIWAFLHTSSVVAEGNPSTGEIAAGLIVPACIAAGYLTWFARSRRALAS